MGVLIQWETDMQKAMNRAHTENKPMLLDFFDAG